MAARVLKLIVMLHYAESCKPHICNRILQSQRFEIHKPAVGKKEEVVAWLNKYGIKYDKLIMVEHSKDKLRLGEEYNIPIFVDDNPILADMAISSKCRTGPMNPHP